MRCDVSKVDEVERLIDATVERYGRIDCLINNAGWHPPHKPIDDFSVEDFRDLLDLNLVSIFAACKSALPHLRKRKGNIINMSSLVGTHGPAPRHDLRRHQGRHHRLHQGAGGRRGRPRGAGELGLARQHLHPAVAGGDRRLPRPGDCRADGDAAQLLGRMGTIEEAGRLCLFLAAEATFTTGVDHILSGGAELAYGRKSADSHPDQS